MATVIITHGKNTIEEIANTLKDSTLDITIREGILFGVFERNKGEPSLKAAEARIIRAFRLNHELNYILGEDHSVHISENKSEIRMIMHDEIELAQRRNLAPTYPIGLAVYLGNYPTGSISNRGEIFEAFERLGRPCILLAINHYLDHRFYHNVK